MRRTFALLAVTTAALLAALYFFFRPAQVVPAPPDADTAKGPAGAAESQKPPRMEFTLNVAGGRLVSGPAVLQVARGTEVVIRIRSDRADQLHLHGYDLERRIDPDEPAELRFVALRTGRFPYELHRSNVELGVLEVRPESSQPGSREAREPWPPR